MGTKAFRDKTFLQYKSLANYLEENFGKASGKVRKEFGREIACAVEIIKLITAQLKSEIATIDH